MIVTVASTPAELTTEQLFRAATGVYEFQIDDFNTMLRRHMLTADDAKTRLKGIYEAEKGAYAALKKHLEGMPNGKKVWEYVVASTEFARHWAECHNRKVDPLSPQLRRITKQGFEIWRERERAYTALGFRAISFEDWQGAFIQDENMTIKAGVICQVLVKRKSDEEPVHHALALRKKHNKLKI